MSNWKYRICLSDLRAKYEEKEITIVELSLKISERLRTLKIKQEDTRYKNDLKDIIIEFVTSCNDTEDFDCILNKLYDWGDIRLNTRNDIIQDRLCWIGFAF